MDITPGTISEVRQALRGGMIEITPDVAEVAQRLVDIDPALRLRFSEAQGVFVVFEVHKNVDGSESEHLVTTSRECDQRLVNRIRELTDPGYDFVAEIERLEAQSERDKQHEFRERTGESVQRLRHAMRKDLGVKNTAFVPGKEPA